VNSEQAKEILTLYRPGTADSSDPDFSVALGQAKRDPELGRWLEQHCAGYERTREKFRQIPVPAGLKEQILSERKIHTTKQVRLKVALAVATFAVAVGLGVLIGTIHLTPREDLTFNGFRNRMAKTVSRGDYPVMDLVGADLKQIHGYLAANERGDYALPPTLERTRTTGCALLKWQNNPVAMICFNSGRNKDPKQPDLFLFIITRAQVPGAPQGKVPQYTQLNQLTTASWSAGDKTYILGTLSGRDLLQTVL
jgi:hypothetical protein